MPQNDVIVDTNIMCLYGTAGGRNFKAIFTWLDCCGSLCVSQHLLKEYAGHGSPLVAGLLQTLMKTGRFSKIKRSTLAAFAALDGHFHYTCSPTDIPVARTVFRSYRKLIVSLDAALRNDVNNFGIVGTVMPRAVSNLAPADMVPRPTKNCAFH
jgi:hypothetical protein